MRPESALGGGRSSRRLKRVPKLTPPSGEKVTVHARGGQPLFYVLASVTAAVNRDSPRERLPRPFCLAHRRISRSCARGFPIVDQCVASCPARASTGIHAGDRFMSIRSFMQERGARRFPQPARPRRSEPGECPLPPGMGTGAEYPLLCGLRQRGRQVSQP